MPDQIIIEVRSKTEIVEELKLLAEMYFRLPIEERNQILDRIQGKLGRVARADIRQRQLFKRLTIKERRASGAPVPRERGLTDDEMTLNKHSAIMRSGR